MHVLRNTRNSNVMLMPGVIVSLLLSVNSPGEWDANFHSAEYLLLLHYWDVD